MTGAVDLAVRYVDRLSDAYRADGVWLGVVRILFAAHVLLFPVDVRWIGQVPDDFFQPRAGLFQAMSGPPEPWFLDTLTVLRAVVAAGVLVGFRTVALSIALTVVLVTSAGISYTYGKIDHFVLYEVFPLFMAFAGWGSRLSVDARLSRERRETHGFPVFLLALTTAFALFSAALPKVVGGWLDPLRHASRGHIAADVADGQRVGVIAPFLMDIDVAWFWKAFDYATIFAEAWLVVAVFFPLLFRIGLALVIGFHLGVELSLGIDFSSYLFVYLVFFSPVFTWLVTRFRTSPAPPGTSPQPALDPG